MPFNYRKKFRTLNELLAVPAVQKILKQLPARTHKEIAKKATIARPYVTYLLKELVRFHQVDKIDGMYRSLRDIGFLKHGSTLQRIEAKLLFPSYWVDSRVYPTVLEALRNEETLDYLTAKTVMSRLDREARTEVLQMIRAKCSFDTHFESEKRPTDEQLRDGIIRCLWRAWLPLIMAAALPCDGKETRKNRVSITFEVEYSIQDDLDIYLLLRCAREMLSDLDEGDMMIVDGGDDELYEKLNERINHLLSKMVIDKERLQKTDKLLDQLNVRSNWIELMQTKVTSGPPTAIEEFKRTS